MAEYGGYDDDESPPSYGDDDRQYYDSLIRSVRRSPTLTTPTQGTQPRRTPMRVTEADFLSNRPIAGYGQMRTAMGNLSNPDQPVTEQQFLANAGVAGNALPQTVAAAQGPGPGVEARRRADQIRQQALDSSTRMPDMTAAIEANRRRSIGASDDLFTAMQLRSMGGEEAAPFATAIGNAAIRAREPEEVPGGWGTIRNGVFTPNLFKQREVEITRQLAIADDLDRRAALEVNEVERERAHRAAEQARADALRMHQENIAEQQALRRQQFEQGKWQKVKDAEGNEYLYNTSTKERIDPNAMAGGAPGAPGTRPPPKLNEAQTAAVSYGKRIKAANEILEQIGTDYGVSSLAAKRGLAKTPYVGGLLEAGANVTLSQNSQRVERAQRDFINAILRRESGAVISESEFDNAQRQYFPMPGDRPEVLREKAEARARALEIFTQTAGPGARLITEQASAIDPQRPPSSTQRAFPRTRDAEANRQAEQLIDEVVRRNREQR